MTYHNWNTQNLLPQDNKSTHDEHYKIDTKNQTETETKRFPEITEISLRNARFHNKNRQTADLDLLIPKAYKIKENMFQNYYIYA